MRSTVAFVSLVIAAAIQAQPLPPLPEAPDSSIGYSSVEEALTALKKKPGIEVSEQNGWTVATDVETRAQWSFTPQDHPAHPSAVKRSIVEGDDGVHLEMQVLCEATKEPCDQLVREFQALNDSVLSQVAPYEPDIAVQTLGDNRYELSLTSEIVLEIDTALALLVPTAEELCEGLSPEFGRYRFSSTEPIAGENVDERPTSYVFVQELECSVVSRSTDDRAVSSTIDSETEAEEVTNTVRAMSIEYLTDIANERYEEAYAVVDDDLRVFSTPESWEAGKRSLRAAVGAVVALKISRVTIYDNPPGAPRPGLYVAADYDNEYENAPIHCGYLMWFLRDGGEFRITREESGHVTSQQLSTIPAEQVPVIRQQLRCVAP